MNNVCKCGGTNFFMETNGNQVGLYCSDCGKWQKWLTKDEIRVMKHLQRSQDNHYQNHDMKLKERLMDLVFERAIKVSTVETPHTYMKAVGTNELRRIIDKVFDEE